MKKSAKLFLAMLAPLLLSISSCKPREGWFGGVPIESDLVGTWKLERIVTPNRTVWDKQIGYTEILKSYNKNGDDVEETYRNDTLAGIQYWSRRDWPIAKTKDWTVLVSYRHGLKRFYKMHRTVSQPTVLEASAYLPEIGTKADTVKYFYREVW